MWSLWGRTREARPQLRRRFPVRIQFPVGGLSRGPQLIRQLARTTHTAPHLRGASLWSGDKPAAYFLTESKGNQRAVEAARVHPLLLILEVTLVPAQSQDSKWMLLGGGCQELLQMLVQGCKKRSELDSLKRQRLQRFRDFSQGLRQAWLSLQALGRTLSRFSSFWWPSAVLGMPWPEDPAAISALVAVPLFILQ